MPSLHRLIPAVLLLMLLTGAWQIWARRAVSVREGVVAPLPPLQTSIPNNTPEWQKGTFVIRPMARYELTARVLSTEPYAWDAGAAVAPIDVAVAWGRMSDTAVLRELKISQGQRYFTYRYERPPLPPEEMVRSAANMHMIPANADVEAALRKLRAGQVMHATGYLVSVRGKDGFTWESSLTRDDSGAGACELMWVESIATVR